MPSVFEIPLTPGTPQRMHISLGGTDYMLNFRWNTIASLWFMDIADTHEVPILQSISLVTGANLLAQYGYTGIPGSFVCQGAGNPDNPPDFNTLGVTSHLFWIG